MNRIVVYNSKTGFTAQYAGWIAEELGCEAKSIKEVTAGQLSECEQVIFGGWIMGNLINGLNKLKEMKVEPDVIFATGVTPHYEEVMEKIKEENQLGETPFFYMEGGMKFDQLAFPQKMLLKALKKVTAKKQDRDRQGDFMAEVLGTTFDHTDRKQIAELVEYCVLHFRLDATKLKDIAKAKDATVASIVNADEIIPEITEQLG